MRQSTLDFSFQLLELFNKPVFKLMANCYITKMWLKATVLITKIFQFCFQDFNYCRFFNTTLWSFVLY